jgi:hypothetical protein
MNLTTPHLFLATVTLARGSHTDPGGDLCLLEATALFAGEPLTDHPRCVSPILTGFGISLNDQWGDAQRQKLLRFVPLLPGTAGDGQDGARSYLALDWLIRTHAPAWLDLAGLTAQAAELRSQPPIADLAAAHAAAPAVRRANARARAAWAAARDAARAAARDAAWVAAGGAAGVAARDVAGDAAWATAWDAARDAAGDAAWDAAGGAAGVAAWDAAWGAAWVAAGDAAGDAAGGAAGVAARDALKPTIDLLQQSALDLFAAMINPAGVS